MCSRHSPNGNILGRREPLLENNKYGKREKKLVARTLVQEDFIGHDIWQYWNYNAARFGHGQFHGFYRDILKLLLKEPV